MSIIERGNLLVKTTLQTWNTSLRWWTFLYWNILELLLDDSNFSDSIYLLVRKILWRCTLFVKLHIWRAYDHNWHWLKQQVVPVALESKRAILFYLDFWGILLSSSRLRRSSLRWVLHTYNVNNILLCGRRLHATAFTCTLLACHKIELTSSVGPGVLMVFRCCEQAPASAASLGPTEACS